MSWQLLTIASVFMFAISLILQRVLLHKYKCEPFAYATVSQMLVGLITLVIAIFLGLNFPNFDGLMATTLSSSKYSSKEWRANLCRLKGL